MPSLPRAAQGLGRRGRGGHLPHLGQGSVGLKSHGGPEDSGLLAHSEAQKIGKNTSQPQRAGKQTAYPSQGELLCNSKAPLNPHPVTLQVDPCHYIFMNFVRTQKNIYRKHNVVIEI